MKVSVVQGGGIAGLVTTTEADTASMAPDDATKLARHVEACQLAAAPPDDGGPVQPDEMSYEVTVEDGDATHVARFRDSTLPDEVRSLITVLDALPEAQTQVGPPGAGAP